MATNCSTAYRKHHHMKMHHKFVEHIPDDLSEKVLYISIPFTTAVHLCACGCGREIVTPFTPADWRLIFDGETVSLDPSIGNWSLSCRSHYWIERGSVQWAEQWSDERVRLSRTADKRRRARIAKDPACAPKAKRVEKSLWRQLLFRLLGR